MLVSTCEWFCDIHKEEKKNLRSISRSRLRVVANRDESPISINHVIIIVTKKINCRNSRLFFLLWPRKPSGEIWNKNHVQQRSKFYHSSKRSLFIGVSYNRIFIHIASWSEKSVKIFLREIQFSTHHKNARRKISRTKEGNNASGWKKESLIQFLISLWWELRRFLDFKKETNDGEIFDVIKKLFLE